MGTSESAAQATLAGRRDERTSVLIAANPYSGTGPTRKRVDRLRRALDQFGFASRVVWDATERAATLADPELARWCSCVVVAGGDGTIADVINEQHGAVPLATLPVGNENLFARQFGFPAQPELLARAIARGYSRAIDLGRVGGRLFSLMTSVGLDADVVHRLARWRAASGSPKRVSRLTYAKPILAALRSYAYSPLVLEADGEPVPGTHCLVFNLPRYGFQLGFAPEASGDDGLLDWVVFERPGWRAVISYFSAVLRARHRERPDVQHGQARKLRVTSAVPLPVQADGDPAGCTPAELSVVPAALRVVVIGDAEGWDDGSRRRSPPA